LFCGSHVFAMGGEHAPLARWRLRGGGPGGGEGRLGRRCGVEVAKEKEKEESLKKKRDRFARERAGQILSFSSRGKKRSGATIGDRTPKGGEMGNGLRGVSAGFRQEGGGWGT